MSEIGDCIFAIGCAFMIVGLVLNIISDVFGL